MNLQTILTDLGVIMGALIAIDNALDAILELFGNTKWETRLTVAAKWLKNIQNQLPKAGG